MSQKEADRYSIISRLIDKEINGTEAGKILRLSVRQVKRLKSKVKNKGAAGLVHGNREKPSNRRISEKELKEIKELLHKNYSDFKPGLAAEKLNENHNIRRDPGTIRQIMTSEGLWKSKKRGRKKQEHRQWRERKPHYGEMEQFDGSYRDWFEGRTERCCLLASIDDATGKITKARFAKDEGVIPVFTFWKDYFKIRGKPRVIYLDKFSTYKMNQKVALANRETLTQFQRAMYLYNLTRTYFTEKS